MARRRGSAEINSRERISVYKPVPKWKNNDCFMALGADGLVFRSGVAPRMSYTGYKLSEPRMNGLKEVLTRRMKHRRKTLPGGRRPLPNRIYKFRDLHNVDRLKYSLPKSLAGIGYPSYPVDLCLDVAARSEGYKGLYEKHMAERRAIFGKESIELAKQIAKQIANEFAKDRPEKIDPEIIVKMLWDRGGEDRSMFEEKPWTYSCPECERGITTFENTKVNDKFVVGPHYPPRSRETSPKCNGTGKLAVKTGRRAPEDYPRFSPGFTEVHDDQPTATMEQYRKFMEKHPEAVNFVDLTGIKPAEPSEEMKESVRRGPPGYLSQKPVEPKGRRNSSGTWENMEPRGRCIRCRMETDTSGNRSTRMSGMRYSTPKLAVP